MSNSDMAIYALPGTKEWVRCFEWNAPEGFILMLGVPPLNGLGTHIADESGEWIIPTENYTESYNANISLQRAAEYLEVAPIEHQLEAITESHMGRPEKLDAMLAKFQEIRLKYPKM